MSAILVVGGRLIDPASGLDREGDLLVVDGRIAAVGDVGRAPAGCQEVDARGQVVAPGLVDMHVHLREPGKEEVETIRSGARAAIAGGYTSVACMPNTDPPVDNEASAEFVVLQGRRAAMANVFPVGAITKGLAGQDLAEMGGLARGGAVAFSDDGNPVQNAEVMRRGLLYAKMFGRVVINHCEDLDLAAGGVMNRGLVSTLLGLPGKPNAAEDVMIARDIALVEMTGAPYHVAHLSTRGGVDLVRRAKAQGLPVTCEVTPHHFTLTEEAVRSFDPVYKMNPPLRTKADVEAILEGLRDGTVDAIASDHAPHAAEDKDQEFSYAPNGVIGLETTLPVTVTALLERGVIPLARAIALLSTNPARILRLGEGRGTLAVGAAADVSVIDLASERTIDAAGFQSKSRNCPYQGWRARGRATCVIVGGKVVGPDA